MLDLVTGKSLETIRSSVRLGNSALWLMFLPLVVSLCATGCSTFDRDWKAAAATTVPVNDISGCWQGTWRSDVNGHTDKLRCLVARQSETNYTARFHAKYHKILSFGYTVNLAVKESGEMFHFQGEANLGKLAGGIYDYVGEASATNFFSTYRCKYDHGIFQMARPE